MSCISWIVFAPKGGILIILFISNIESNKHPKTRLLYHDVIPNKAAYVVLYYFNIFSNFGCLPKSQWYNKPSPLYLSRLSCASTHTRASHPLPPPSYRHCSGAPCPTLPRLTGVVARLLLLRTLLQIRLVESWWLQLSADLVSCCCLFCSSRYLSPNLP